MDIFLKNVTLPMLISSSVKVLTLDLFAQRYGEREGVGHFVKNVPRYSIDAFNYTKQIVTKMLKLEKSAQSFVEGISSCPVIFIDLKKFKRVICKE